MPIYEYRCKECEHEVEALQKLSDPPLVTCPACGKPTLQKLVSAAGFQLKGSGWYVTDFRGGGRRRQEGGKGSREGRRAGRRLGEERDEERDEEREHDQVGAGRAGRVHDEHDAVELVGKLAYP